MENDVHDCYDKNPLNHYKHHSRYAMEGIACTDTFAFKIEHSNSTSSSLKCARLVIFAVCLASPLLTHNVKC